MVTMIRKFEKGVCTECRKPLEGKKKRICTPCAKEKKKQYLETKRVLFKKDPADKSKGGIILCLCCEGEFFSMDLKYNRLCKICSCRSDTYEVFGVYL